MATRLVLFCVSFYSAFSLAGLGTFCYHCPAAVRRVGYSFFAHPQIELRPLVLCNRQSVSLSSPISRTRPNRILILAGDPARTLAMAVNRTSAQLFPSAAQFFSHSVIEKSDIAYFLIINENDWILSPIWI